MRVVLILVKVCKNFDYCLCHVLRVLKLIEIELEGDSGGPLYVYGKVDGKPKYKIAGVVSYGDGCAKQNRAGYKINTSQ